MSVSLKYGDVVDFTGLKEQLRQQVKVCFAWATAKTGHSKQGRFEKTTGRGFDRPGSKAHGTHHAEMMENVKIQEELARGIKCKTTRVGRKASQFCFTDGTFE